MRLFIASILGSVPAFANNCIKIRECEPDEHNENCYNWQSNSWFDGLTVFSGQLNYNFLSQTDLHHSNSALFLKYNLEIANFSNTMSHQGWSFQRKSQFGYKFWRGAQSDEMNTSLDNAVIYSEVKYEDQLVCDQPLNKDCFGLDEMWICDSDMHSFPTQTDPTQPPTEPPTEPPATCTLDDLNIVIDSSFLVEKGWKKGKAKQVMNNWNKQVIKHFKTEFQKSKNDDCKDASDFLCSELEIPNSKDGDAQAYLQAHYDWAENIFLR